MENQNRFWLNDPFDKGYLTESEVKVLKEVMFNTERGVARQLGMSRGTVSTHILNIRTKLQCKSIHELRKQVIVSGLIHEIFPKE